MTNPFADLDFQLHDWQLDAVHSWEQAKLPYTGTLEIFTGGGKTLIALRCAASVADHHPDLRLAVVVPTEALARQWREAIVEHTGFEATDVGLLGAGGHDDFSGHRVLVAVLNSAAKSLPELALRAQPLMLVVDECHRAGAPTFSRVLDTPARFRLGLSATPEREELDEEGEPLAFDEQLVGSKLGPVVHRFDLRDARRVGWLPTFEVHHHGIDLHPDEQAEYEHQSRRVEELADELRHLGVDSGRAYHLQSRRDDVGEVARSYVAATSRRKDLLYRARERSRIAVALVEQALGPSRPRRILLFHERVDGAAAIYRTIEERHPGAARLEHSRLGEHERSRALADFRDGTASVLVSVKSLVEGIDVPAADVGVSVASSSSVRQRVQSLGRVLRRQFATDAADSVAKEAEMHLVYVADTVDESIYRKEDWGDLTGEAANRYWRWPLDPEEAPEAQEGPPASPRPSEEQEWQRLGARGPETPVPWHGDFVGQEYSVDTLDTVTNSWGRTITNPQAVGDMVTAVRGRPGGRFRVTPIHRLVLVAAGDERSDGGLFVAGALDEPFRAEETPSPDSDVPSADAPSKPGDPYPWPSDESGGVLYLRLKRGGVIERKAAGGSREFALTQGTGRTAQEENARKLLDAWRSVLDRGLTVHVDGKGRAWYTAGGRRSFLAHIPGGLVWPSDIGE